MIWKDFVWIIRHLLLWGVPLSLIVLLFAKTNSQQARVLDDGRIEFAPTRIAIWFWLLITIYFAFLCFDYLQRGGWKSFDHLCSALFGTMALTAFFSFPGKITVASDGLEQVSWFWKNKHLGWPDIVEINTGQKSSTVTIAGADGTKIVHSAQLADRARFLFELKQHCGENLPSDFPREPVS